MGLMRMKSCYSSPYAARNSNPDPVKYTIQEEEVVGNFLILRVNYPNCTNFEGDKIIVYKGLKSSQELLKLTDGKLDPHFIDSPSQAVPFARFPPTKEGHVAAYKLATILS